MPKSLSAIALRGALYGLVAWLVYETVEFLVACLLPVALSSQRVFSPGDWRMIPVLFASYAVLGVVLGALAAVVIGLCRSAMDEFQYRASATLTLALFSTANLAGSRLNGSEVVGLVVSALAALAILASAFSDNWRRRAGFLSSPWTVSFLLLVAPWMSEERVASWSRPMKAVASLLAAAAVAIAGMLLYRLFPRRRGPAWDLSATLAALVILIGMAGLLSGRGRSMGDVAIRTTPGKFNVLLIVMDTVRADHLSLYGYSRDTTPRLRELAKTATVYTRAIAAADMTLSSHASMFTGLYPGWHHAVYDPPEWKLGRPLNKKFTTLAELLNAKGYFTSAVVANKGYLAPHTNLNKGFATYQYPSPLIVSDWTRPFYLRYTVERLLPRMSESEVPIVRAGAINAQAMASLSKADGKPFFLFMNYMDAHDPYLPPAPFDTLFPGKNGSFSVRHLREVSMEYLMGRPLPDDVKRHLISQYDGGIAYMDAEIGKLIGELRKRGAYDNTMIIVTSDHGEALGDHGLIRHGEDAVYQSDVHVPLIIKYPGQHQGQTANMLVSHVDFMPTILDVLGYPIPRTAQGRSLRTEPPANWFVYSESYPEMRKTDPGPARFKGIRRAIFSGDTKLITWTNGPPEAYDLASDPNESVNLYSSARAFYNPLAAQMASWARSMPTAKDGTRVAGVEDIQNLRSLGYVQ